MTLKEQQQAARRLKAVVLATPGKIAEGIARVCGKDVEGGGRQAHLFSLTDRSYVLMTDGSFRRVPQRRRFGLSGRQLRMARKRARREMLRQAAAAPQLAGN